MKRATKILWGVVLIAAGVIFALNALNITDIDVFFDGWWTLFIIVPCAIGLFTEREKTGNIIGLLIGICLLLACQDILDFGMLWKLIVPAIIIVVGVRLIFGGILGNKSNEVLQKLKANGAELKSGCAVFSGKNMNFDGEVFTGAELTAIFGGVECDLRNAIIETDCVINATAIFGGVDIYLPPYVNVKTNSMSLFGGMSNKIPPYSPNNRVTVYVNGTCMFGGVEIK